MQLKPSLLAAMRADVSCLHAERWYVLILQNAERFRSAGAAVARKVEMKFSHLYVFLNAMAL